MAEIITCPWCSGDGELTETHLVCDGNVMPTLGSGTNTGYRIESETVECSGCEGDGEIIDPASLVETDDTNGDD